MQARERPPIVLLAQPDEAARQRFAFANDK
jgi:hypothetical protein